VHTKCVLSSFITHQKCYLCRVYVDSTAKESMAVVSQSLPRKSLRESVPLTKEICDLLERYGYIRNGVLTKGPHRGERAILSDQLPTAIHLPSSDISDVSWLIHVEKLDLSKCYNLVDLSPFERGTVKSLTLDWCGRIKDVSPLAGITHLDLRSCFNITGVASLAKGCVKSLILSTLNEISSLKDSTTLKTLKIFWAITTAELVTLTGISTLTELWLSDGRRIDDISSVASSNIQTFRMHLCEALKDVSPLANSRTLKYVSLINSQIEDVSVLGTIPTLESLDLTGSMYITDVSMLQNVKTLYLNECHGIHSVEGLEKGRISLLHLDGCHNITDISTLWKANHLEQLYIDRTRVTNISSLGWSTTLRSLSLCCRGIEDVSCLKGCKSLKKIRLPRKIKGVDMLRDSVTIDMLIKEEIEEGEEI